MMNWYNNIPFPVGQYAALVTHNQSPKKEKLGKINNRKPMHKIDYFWVVGLDRCYAVVHILTVISCCVFPD